VEQIIITGASRGLGKFIFEKYSSYGAPVIGTCNATVRPGLYPLNIADENDVCNFFSQFTSTTSRITLLNVAGINSNSLAQKFSAEAFRSVLDVNLLGSFLMTKYALKIMRSAKYGRIINFSSVVPQRGVPGTAAYAASKAGLWGFSKAVASENAAFDITSNCLNLGYFDTGMIKEVPDAALEAIVSSIPMKKLGDPEDVFHAVEFLRKSNYVTGACIDINGGLY